MDGTYVLSWYIFTALTVIFHQSVGQNVTRIGYININQSPVSLQFESKDVTLVEAKTIDLYFNYTVHDSLYGYFKIAAKIKDEENAEIIGDNEIYIDDSNKDKDAKFTVRGKFLGRTLLEFFIQQLHGNYGNKTLNGSQSRQVL